MSVLIRGMEMPKCPTAIRIQIEADGSVYQNSDKTGNGWALQKNVTAIEVPPHGDLIDRDKLPIECITFSKGKMYRAGTDIVFVKDILDAPTIIPAEPCKEKGE